MSALFMTTDQEAMVWMTRGKAYRELSGIYLSMSLMSVSKDKAERLVKNCQYGVIPI